MEFNKFKTAASVNIYRKSQYLGKLKKCLEKHFNSQIERKLKIIKIETIKIEMSFYFSSRQSH